MWASGAGEDDVVGEGVGRGGTEGLGVEGAGKRVLEEVAQAFEEEWEGYVK